MDGRFVPTIDELKAAGALLRDAAPPERFSPGFMPAEVHLLFRIAMLRQMMELEGTPDVMIEDQMGQVAKMLAYCLGLHDEEALAFSLPSFVETDSFLRSDPEGLLEEE